jgi:hypothetical protein
VLYAVAWRAERKPWTMISGGPEGGVYQSTDGGDTWKKLAGGLPTGIVGKIGITVSPANPDRVWAMIEAEPNGGVYLVAFNALLQRLGLGALVVPRRTIV